MAAMRVFVVACLLSCGIVACLLSRGVHSASDTTVCSQGARFVFDADSQGFNVSVDGIQILKHTKDEPIVYLGGGKTKFVEHHGNFEIKDYVNARVPLDDFYMQTQKEGFVILTMSHLDLHKLVLVLSSTDTHPLVVTFGNLPSRNDRLWFRTYAEQDEFVYGGGEQFSYFNLRGHNFPIWTREQGVGRNKSTMITVLSDLDHGAGGDYHTTYYPEPTFFSSRHYYCHLDIENYSMMDFEHDSFHEIEMWGQPQQMSFDVAPSMQKLTEKFSAYIGRQPVLPDWVLEGVSLGIQGGTQQMLGYLDQAERHGMVVRGLWIQDWVGRITTSFGRRLFWDWKWDQKQYPDLDKVIKQLKARDIRVMGYINPNLNKEGDLFKTADKLGYFVKNSEGSTYVIDFGEFFCGTIDMTNPKAFDWYKGVIKTNMIDLGLGGWMADFGEYLPVDAVFYNGKSGQEMHNIWPMLWAKLNREAIEEAGVVGEVVYWMRAGYTGTQNYSVLTWAGDQNVDFSYGDGIASTIPAALSLGVQGMGLTHFDIGGFTSLFTMTRTEELLLRSAEYAVFTPVMRSHEGNRPASNYQYYSANSTLDAFARLSKLHQLLLNYTRLAVKQNSESGIPVQRPLFFQYPETKANLAVTYEYMYGDDLLVAPVFLENQTDWNVHLPDDEWVYLWNSTETRGPAEVNVEAPIGKPPVFYRKSTTWKDVFEQMKQI